MFRSLTLALACFGSVIGCGKSQPQPLTDGNFSAELNKTFAKANGETKDMIQQATQNFESKNFVAANASISTLLSRPDLSNEERAAASQALISLNQKIAQAAEQGDPMAQQLQRMKAASK